MTASSQRPLELILARNLLSTLSTPAMLVNQPGDVILYNEAAGALLGRRFEEAGTMPAGEWVELFGPAGASAFGSKRNARVIVEAVKQAAKRIHNAST